MRGWLGVATGWLSPAQSSRAHAEELERERRALAAANEAVLQVCAALRCAALHCRAIGPGGWLDGSQGSCVVVMVCGDEYACA